MLNDADWLALRADLDALIGDNVQEIVIRRGQTTLDGQDVRIVRAGTAGTRIQGMGTEESRATVLVYGDIDLDIQPEDKFVDGAGLLYRVVLVRPNRRVGMVAEAVVMA